DVIEMTRLAAKKSAKERHDFITKNEIAQDGILLIKRIARCTPRCLPRNGTSFISRCSSMQETQVFKLARQRIAHLLHPPSRPEIAQKQITVLANPRTKHADVIRRVGFGHPAEFVRGTI